ncbi:sugar ABC transporter ATP-binding protein [Oharaeibacter diazotrophicus]|uniref:Monosaccharide ABC transporter ATP-binding protein (CUT2 family) n=1 Tax=Oharaeibacter diazotrophicus TaxID=1920512 RepID=A0A4R6RPM1_9HYPH|nr:monosaccharide ABC transporter ATP-binding protein (CUT2 family) [Oharaeibacter diazotrophicus]BBE74612.1 ribose import ATP-binding protein RbsA [Pleomorphomonas sp. SM30]GLS76987.1 sugar ABC transporter ATP-binding protein [Oharaeibacter diazotrophicus]
MTSDASAAALRPADGAPAIRMSAISKVFGGVRALDDVSFEVGRGEVHCLAGENGCGKSTLIKIISGVYTPEPGAVMEYFGRPETGVTPNAARAHGIAVIWQDLALFGEMTVAENIAFETLVGGRPRLVSDAALRATAAAALGRLGVDLDLDARVATLAIADRQVVAIARALVSDARLIFMDEPTASLTQAETDKLLDVVRTLSARGVAIVFVSHRLAEVLEIASRVTVIRDGRLVGVFPASSLTQGKLTELMTGRTFERGISARDVAANPVAIEVKGLTRRGEFEDVDLTIRAGEVVGLTGLIGAGRTELAHVLFGMARPDRGAIRLAGREVRFRSNREAIAAGVAYVSEDRLQLGLVQPQSIADNLTLTVLPALSDRNGLVSPARKADLVARWIRDLAVKIGRPEDAVSTLSGGNQQRIVLAKWLATGPKVLILDCPTVGVDVGAREGIFRVVRDLAERGLAILLISDEVSEVHMNADRILHMAGGRIVGEYDPRVASIADLEAAIYA